ncbi:hypothetical protein Tco_0879045 [Tanacetum coccineum]
MASDGNDQDARYALSKLLQRGTVAEYKREAFSIARIIEARFETIAGKKLNIKEKIDIVLSWPSEEAPPVIKGSLDANEDIGVVELSENKESVEEVVVGGGEACEVGEDELNRVISALKDGGGEFDGRLDEINLNLSEELADHGVSPIPTSLMAHESPRVRQLWERIGIGDAHGLMDNGRNHKFEWGVLQHGWRKAEEWCCVMSKVVKAKRKKGVCCGSGRQENYGNGRRDCGRIKIWDPGIKIYFRHHVKDKVVVKEWGRIRPQFG